MELSKELSVRGFVHQHTSESLETVIDSEKRTIYHGIDPTADSAHAGNMAVWMLLRHLANNGHTVIFLVGGGTGMIGDPKPDVERTLKSEEEIDANVAKIKAQAEKLVGGGNEVIFVNNKDWLTQLGLLEFLRDIGKHFTVNELIKKDAIATRVASDNGISYTEFAYPLLQAFDYLTLHREHGCDLQVGGSDQWGNIVAGVDLVRRKEQAEVHALTVPLVTDKATGKKFGKSEGNAVWLDPEKTTPYAFYQFWLNVSDESVVDYLKLFTFLSLDEIEIIATEHLNDPAARIAQKKLALEVTTFVHNEADAAAAAKVAETLFSGAPLSELSEDEKGILKASAPLTELPVNTALTDTLVASGLATSKREARTFIESGAVSIGGNKVEDIEAVLSGSVGELQLIKRGKKNLSLVELVA